MPETGGVTRLLKDWARGNQQAADELAPLVYGTLRRLAAKYLGDERHVLTFQPTALVHEAYLRMVEQDLPDWQSRSHFFGVAAHLMRQVLVDHARERLSQKRGAGAIRLDMDAATGVAAVGAGYDVIALSDALDALAGIDQRKTRIIELRYFGGFTEEETARALELSVATVRRQTRLAEAWLYTELNRQESA